MVVRRDQHERCLHEGAKGVCSKPTRLLFGAVDSRPSPPAVFRAPFLALRLLHQPSCQQRRSHATHPAGGLCGSPTLHGAKTPATFRYMQLTAVCVTCIALREQAHPPPHMHGVRRCATPSLQSLFSQRESRSRDRFIPASAAHQLAVWRRPTVRKGSPFETWKRGSVSTALNLSSSCTLRSSALTL